MATKAEQRAAEQRRREAAAAAAGTLAVGYVGAQAGQAVGQIPTTGARAAASGTILAALVAFLTAQRGRAREFLVGELPKRRLGASVPSTDDVAAVIAEEQQREEAFAAKQAERFTADLATVTAIPDRAAREAAIRGLVAREERYARQRAEAMAARAFAAIDRVVLRRESPQGALWKLDPTVMEHTAGCLLMGGKFWPWAVLDRVHPPRHAGCPCRLVGYGEAVADGLMSAGDVLDVKTAIRRAAAVVMEGALVLDDVNAELLIEEAGGRELLALRSALLEQRMTTEAAFDALEEDFDPAQRRDTSGRWSRGAGTVAALTRAAENIPAGGWKRHAGVTLTDKGHGFIGVAGPGGRSAMAQTPAKAAEHARRLLDEAKGADTSAVEGLRDPKAFAAVFDGFSHGGLTARVSHSERVGDDLAGTEVEGDIVDGAGKVVGYFVRDIGEAKTGLGPDGKQGGLWAYHNELRLLPEAQRKGFATALQDHAEKAYRAAGVKEVRLDAQDAGTVVWAKRGFEPIGTFGSGADAVRAWEKLIERHAEDFASWPAADVKALRKALASGDIAKVAASPQGELLLSLLKRWRGRKIL